MTVPPAIISLSPSSPAGTEQILELVASHPAGSDKIRIVQLMIGPSLSGERSCWLEYSPPTRVVRIRSDDGRDWVGVSEGGSQKIANSQCSVDLPKVTATADGLLLRISFPLLVSKSLELPASINAIASTDQTHSGWKAVGTWTPH